MYTFFLFISHFLHPLHIHTFHILHSLSLFETISCTAFPLTTPYLTIINSRLVVYILHTIEMTVDGPVQ